MCAISDMPIHGQDSYHIARLTTLSIRSAERGAAFGGSYVLYAATATLAKGAT